VVFVPTFGIMKTSTNRIILTFITVTVIATIALQLHWNIKNYEENKRRIFNDIQIAFDTGVENYYANKAKSDFMHFDNDSMYILPVSRMKIQDSTKTTITYSRKFGQNGKMISVIKSDGKFYSPDEKQNMSDVKTFATKIVVAMLRDSIEFKKLDSTFSNELKRKGIMVVYGFEYSKPHAAVQVFQKERKIAKPFSMLSKSTYLPPKRELKLRFSDPVFLAMERSMTEVILSLLLSLSIIFCLLYLLRIINRQKKIDEIRNDLISNITHEFKTPITTISSAIEGIRNFNAANDKEKTNRYLDISERQLDKLSIMVEKLLETATLDTGEILLNKEPVDVVGLLKSVIEKHRIISKKTISFIPESDSLVIDADVFHLENALSNLVDNAIKYGRNEVDIHLGHTKNKVEITVSDNGNPIDKWHREKIFEKFYRIPKGNIHDVKGFGIGLYYSRKIIEKHDGKIELLSADKTTFKITLPYA
jgi:signal transduction histidine kinase